MNKLIKGLFIKVEDSFVLWCLLILFIGCKNILKEIGYFNKVENFDILKMIVNRLLYGLKLKWCDVVDRIIEMEEWEIIIEDVDGFVILKVCVVIYVIFGNVIRDNLVFFGGLKFRNKLFFKVFNFVVDVVF